MGIQVMAVLGDILAVLILVLLPQVANATAQFPDRIHHQGKEYPLHINPLEQYFEPCSGGTDASTAVGLADQT